MDMEVEETPGFAPIVHFTLDTPVEKKNNNSISTSGIGNDSITSSTDSLKDSNESVFEDRSDKDPSLLLIPDHPFYEVKFQSDYKDSIISIPNFHNDSRVSKKPKIPDGGWGWMVVFASLIISTIADGISFSFGLLYIEFLQEFNESKSKTSWIGSLFMAVPLLSGPIMSALVDRYGCRKMTILGGLISSIGFVISSRVKSIEVLFVTFGIISGLGLGLCYVTAVVCIAYWFDKKRTLAVGLGACGTGIGTFVYAPITQYFIDEYQWRGTTLLLAGSFLNMCVCGCLMRDPEWWKQEQNRGSSNSGSKSKLRNISSRNSLNDRNGMDPESGFTNIEDIQNMLKKGEESEYILEKLVTSINKVEDDNHPKEECRSVISIPTFIKQNERVPLEVLESLSANKKIYNVILENYPSLLICRSTSDKGLNKLSENGAPTRIPLTMSMKIKRAKDQIKNAEDGLMNEEPFMSPLLNHHTSMNKEPVYGNNSIPWLKRQFMHTNTHYFKHIRIHRNSLMYRGAMMNIHKYRLRASSCPNIYKNSMTTLARENEEKWYADFLELLKGMVDFSMFLETHFLLMSLSTILLFVWFIVPYFYLADHLTHHGYTENDAPIILSVIGITNTIGMVGLGWAGDQPWMNITKTYAVCLILCGFATISMICFTSNYFLLVTSAALFGLFFASSFSFTPVILVELVPLEKFTTAYGLILLCQGIGNLVGPPLAGWIYDVTNKWETSFTHAGIWIIVSGILIGIIPYTENKRLFGKGSNEKNMKCYT